MHPRSNLPLLGAGQGKQPRNGCYESIEAPLLMVGKDRISGTRETTEGVTTGVSTDRLLVVGEDPVSGVALCKGVHHVAGLPREQDTLHGGVLEVVVRVLVMSAHDPTWCPTPHPATKQVGSNSHMLHILYTGTQHVHSTQYLTYVYTVRTQHFTYRSASTLKHWNVSWTTKALVLLLIIQAEPFE